MADPLHNVYTPLRYPGGKARLAPFFKDILKQNTLCGCHYAEPYAGGGGVALSLLLTQYCSHIHLNDISYPLYCFWKSVLDHTDQFCKQMTDTPVTPKTWDSQKEVMRHYSDFSAEELGFAFFFLNRTNRSGILNGGMIGGRAQTGKWLIDARYNKDTLISRIENIAEYKHKISIHNMDAKDFLESIIPSLPERSLVYLDPPYYVKGRDLYADHYSHDDHKQISDIIQEQIKQSWVVTYDYCDAIVKFYRKRRCYVYSLGYSAFEYRVGSELMIFCDSIKVPEAAFIRPEDGIAA